MTHHIAVGEVNHDEIVFLSLYRSHEFVFYLEGRHLWLQVIGSHLGRWNKDTVLSFVWCFAAAIEKERNVSILLSLCCMQLTLAEF